MHNFEYDAATSLFKVPVYENALASDEDVAGFILEGQAKIDFPAGRMRLSSALDPALGQDANYVYWCDKIFPSDVLIEWDFTPLAPTGLCILFFSASNLNGKSIFDAAKRTGRYEQYNNGDINAFHVSYFRENGVEKDRLRTCNLRKSKGFHMVAQGGDPIPEFGRCQPPFRLSALKHGPLVAFYVDRILVLSYYDDGITYGPLLGGGSIGFRQMAPMLSEYSNLVVHTISE
jgi:hypothetical protein